MDFNHTWSYFTNVYGTNGKYGSFLWNAPRVNFPLSCQKCANETDLIYFFLGQIGLFFRDWVLCHPLSVNKACVMMRCSLFDRIDLFMRHRVLCLYLSSNRVCVFPMWWSWFRRGFLRLIASTEDSMRDDFLLRGQRFAWCWTVMLGLWGIFAPSHRHQSWHRLSRVSCKALWSSRYILWLRCSFVGHYSTLDGVEAFM